VFGIIGGIVGLGVIIAIITVAACGKRAFTQSSLVAPMVVTSVPSNVLDTSTTTSTTYVPTSGTTNSVYVPPGTTTAAYVPIGTTAYMPSDTAYVPLGTTPDSSENVYVQDLPM